MKLKERKVTPQRAVEILKKQGTIVTIKEAEIILDLAYNFSILAVNQAVRNIKSK